MQKMTKKWEEPRFKKTLLLASDKSWFLNFVVISDERFSGINSATAVTETV